MSGPEDEMSRAGFPPKPDQSIMCLDDLDLDGSWLDSLTFVPNPASPFALPSTSDQPCSPLWAFSDEDRLFLTRASNLVTENPSDNDENKSFPSPFSELVPTDNPDACWVIKERMTRALRCFKGWTDQHVLAQVWAPVKSEGRYVLTTSGQPFVIDPQNHGLRQYRMVSMMYMFSVDGESDGELGLPGRVFRQKLPEWTPNVQYYSSREFPRLHHALHYNVQGTLALPVFEQTGQCCVGVLELILTSQKIHYSPEVDKVCKALQEVNLKSSEILDHPSAQICNGSRQNALAEILEILTVVCETHKLPLAQTWVPCRHRSVLACGGGLKKNCTSFDGSCMGKVCMSTTDVAFYVVDAHMWGFREACVEHHMQKGQGVSGRAFLSQNACFCADITQFCKTEYPLVHYARMFGLTSCFAVCLRSTHTGDDNYVLEFFLPVDMKDSGEKKSLLGSLVATMKQHLKSLKAASGLELEDNEGFIEIVKGFADERFSSRLESIPAIPSPMTSPSRPSPSPNELDTVLQHNPLNQEMDLEFDPIADRSDVGAVNEGRTQANVPTDEDVKRTAKIKRGKTKKTISIDVLQRYFAGSLKDAAKSLGVCPTTMKRICRQHGITRWPSRKINKVNHSLTKLKRVIESVQGAEGAFGLSSLTTSPLPVAVGSVSWPSLNGLKQCQAQHCRSSGPQAGENGSPAQTPGNDGQGLLAYQRVDGGSSSPEEHFPNWSGFPPELGKSLNWSKSLSGSREESIGTPASHGSCQGCAVNEAASVKDADHSPVHQQCFKLGCSTEAFQPRVEMNLPTTEDAHITIGPLEPFGGMPVEHTGSSKDLRSLSQIAAEGGTDERPSESNWAQPPCSNQLPEQPVASVAHEMPHESSRHEKGAAIKATYRDDIIRFRISFGSGINDLREEVAKRLKLEIGTFDFKYLDDDDEWILIACDADFQECLDISRSSGRKIIRLSVHDVVPNLGSSCESTGEL